MDNYSKFYHRNIRYKASHFEEWQEGVCINQGDIETIITIINTDGSIDVKLDNIATLRIVDEFSFDPQFTQVLDRIMYMRTPVSESPVEPIVCNIFVKGQNINYIRFGMSYPDRIIEFYGTLEDYDFAPNQYSSDEDSKGSSKDNSDEQSSIIKNAQNILDELKGEHKDKDITSIIKCATEIQNRYLIDKSQLGQKMNLEAWKLFRQANLLCEDDEGLDTWEYFMDKNQIYKGMAICNARVKNYKAAYILAQKSRGNMRGYKKVSPIQMDDMLERLGESVMSEMIETIEKHMPENIPTDWDYSEFDENKLQALDRQVNSRSGENRNLILDAMNNLISEFSEMVKKEAPSSSSRLVPALMIFITLRNVILYSCEEDGISIVEYLTNPIEIQLYDLLKIDTQKRLLKIKAAVSEDNPFTNFKDPERVKDIFMDILESLIKKN